MGDIRKGIEPDRISAMQAGKSRYDGHPCHKCGGTERYTSSRNCTVCTALRVIKHRTGGHSVEPEQVPPRNLPALEKDPAWIAAKAAGQTRYFGRTCRNGHDGERYVKGAICVHCSAMRAQAFRDNLTKAAPAGVARPMAAFRFPEGASAEPASARRSLSLEESIITPPSRERLMAGR